MSADRAPERPASRGWETRPRSPVEERFYRELMSMEDLPAAPEIAQRMLVAANREDADTRHLASLITRDPSLAARLLRLANSAFFAVRTRVTSIPQAITLLGFPRVRDLALGLSVWGALGGKTAGARRHRRILWVHSVTVATAASLLAERTGGDGATAFAAGLLHDVGKLVLGLRLGESYWALLDEAAEDGRAAAAVEGESFGCHHGTVGGWLLQLWQLPAALADPVARHHEALARESGFDVTAVVAVANRLVDATDPASGVSPVEVLDEVRGFAPGLVGTDDWRELHATLARERQVAARLFDRGYVVGSPRASSARARAQR